MPNMSDAFRGQWRTDFKSWEEVRREKRELQNRTNVGVIVLGPGGGSQGYEKRLELRNHLAKNPYNQVAFLEELLEGENLRDKHEVLRNQAYYIQRADVIIALLVADERVMGVLLEVSHYRNAVQDFESKTWLVLPRPGGKEKHSAKAKGLIQKEVDNFPPTHMLRYNSEEFRDCNKIRSFAWEQVEKARSERFYWDVIRVVV